MNATDRARFLARFWEKVNKTEACWLWTGCLYPNGYGHFGFWLNGATQSHYSHRVAYEIGKGEIPAGLVIDHLCRVRHCVNPDHLEAVTQRVNVLRGAGNASVTACPRGHAYDDANTYIKRDGSRTCRACGREKAAARKGQDPGKSKPAPWRHRHNPRKPAVEIRSLDEIGAAIAALSKAHGAGEV